MKQILSITLVTGALLATACGGVQPEIDETDAGIGEDAALAVDAAPVVEPNIVFLTASASSADLGGLAGADARCAAEAQSAGLPGTYVAWVSTVDIDARDRLEGASGWVRPDGLPVASSIDDLSLGRLLYPINMTAKGETTNGTVVWTGTNANGRVDESGQCGDWGDVGLRTNTTIGFTGSGPVQWTARGNVGCSRTGRLYCFGVDRQATLEPPVADGRVLFVSTATLSGASGVTAFDALCTSEAEDAGLAGSYRALVARLKVAATNRFDLDGEPWFRPDGVKLFDVAADMATSPLLAPIAVTATGAYTTGSVWTGSGSFGEASANDCIDWTDPGPSASTGTAEVLSFGAGGGLDVCSTQQHIYCGQE